MDASTPLNEDETKADIKWIDLASIPFTHKYATPVIYGSDGGIVLSPYGQARAIKIYNHTQNIWNDLLLFKSNKKIKIHTLAINPNTTALHLYDKKQYKFDPLQKTFIQIATQIENMNVISKAKNLQSCFINNEYHIIGYGKNELQHFSWNENKNTFKQYRFYDHLVIDGYALCCLQKAKQILLLGGLDITNKPITCYLNSILCYEETDTGFQMWEDKMPTAMSYFGCILTDDEQYIITFGGQTKGGKCVDVISILNILTHKWTTAEVKCPRIGKYTAVRAGEYAHLLGYDGLHSKILISSILSGIKTTNSKWLSMPKTPSAQFCKPVATVDGNIILSPFNDSNIYIFDTDDCKWSSLVSLPQSVQFNQHTVCLDNKDNKLYLYDGQSDAHFMEIDINTQCIIHNIQTYIPKTGKNPVCVVLNNQLHIVGGFNQCKHLTWNSQSTCFEEHKLQHLARSIQEQGIIALESMKQIIVFGGSELSIFEKYFDKIWICDEKLSWRISIFKMHQGICGFGFVLTKDEKYVILFGGKTKDGLSDEIYMLDTTAYKWTKCQMKCPKKAKYHAVFNSVMDNIHLFEIGTQNHWIIPLPNIIPSYYSKKETKSKGNMNHNGKEPNHLLVTTLQSELQTANERILALEETEQKLMDEIKQLKAENTRLRKQNSTVNQLDNTLSSLSQFITSGTMHINKPLDEWSINKSDVVTDPVVSIVSDMITDVLEEDEMNRPRLPSDTFLLLTDEDFESDVDEQEYEEETDNAEEINVT